MEPKAIRTHTMVRGSDGLLRLEMIEAGRECVLDPLAELIWDLCDGSRSIETLAQAAGQAFDRAVPREEVFAALDFLADAGLIEERVAPPVAEGNVSRRSLLARIAPVVGAAAWVMSGIPARAGGLIQYNESANKESSNKESNRKADNREASNKESNTKAGNREASDKESNTKAGNREVSDKENDRKSRDRESDGKRDWDKQQDAEKGRKRDLKRTFDQINESESKRAARAQYFEQKIKTSWPKVYDIVGHKLSEFPDVLETWKVARGRAVGNQTLTASNYQELFQRTASTFAFQIWLSHAAVTRFSNAGFDLPLDFKHFAPVLTGDSQKKTYLVLEYVANPAIGDNWRYALSGGNLRFQFNDTEAAFQFLSSRQATGAQTRK